MAHATLPEIRELPQSVDRSRSPLYQTWRARGMGHFYSCCSRSSFTTTTTNGVHCCATSSGVVVSSSVSSLCTTRHLKVYRAGAGHHPTWAYNYTDHGHPQALLRQRCSATHALLLFPSPAPSCRLAVAVLVGLLNVDVRIPEALFDTADQHQRTVRPAWLRNLQRPTEPRL